MVGDPFVRPSGPKMTGSVFFRLMDGREVDGPLRAVAGRYRCLRGRASATLGAYMDGLGTLSGPLWAVLGRSRCLCWWSWAAIGAYVGGLGRYRGLCGQSWEGIRSKSGPNPSGKAIWTGDQAEKWPKTEREQDPSPLRPHRPSEAPYPFFL